MAVFGAQGGGDVEQLRIVRRDAGPVAVGIDFDRQLVAHAVLDAVACQCRGHRRRFQQQGKAQATPQQVKRVRQFIRRDRDRIQDVVDATAEEFLGFLQCRNGNAACARGQLAPCHVHAFAGLDVRTEGDTQRIHALLHAQDIPLHAAFVEQQRRGFQRGIGE